MGYSIRKVRAMLKKEVKSMPKNKNVLFICLLPLLFAMMYTNLFSDPNLGMGKMDILFMCLSMNLVLVSSFMIAMLIAEEKEKNTLRTLILSGVEPMEFLLGKILVTFIFSEFTNIAIFFIIGLDAKYLGLYALFTTLVMLCMIGLGAVIGLISPNQMSTGVIGMPILIVLFMVPIFAMISETLMKIAKFLPTYNIKVLLDRVVQGQTIGMDSLYEVGVILAWILISAVAFIITFKKVGLDR
ncbi:MAG: hypothetical protein K0S47_3527 [Herbinix sp.]|jgi:ABC-2 type transport system permease protein|nr:hypothetical protein [Herbinix sp.]